MQISVEQFERELDALIDAALSASSKETARRYLIQAENKIYGYDNIPTDCRQRTPRNYVSRSFFLAIAKVFCLNKHISTGFMTFVIPIPSYILQASLNSCTQK